MVKVNRAEILSKYCPELKGDEKTFCEGHVDQCIAQEEAGKSQFEVVIEKASALKFGSFDQCVEGAESSAKKASFAEVKNG